MRIPTSMHASRMRTVRSLTVSRRGGVCIQGEGVSGEGALHPGGGLHPWGSASMGKGGLHAGGGGLHPRGLGRPPCPHEQTDRCKNITLPKTSFAGGNNARDNKVSWPLAKIHFTK